MKTLIAASLTRGLWPALAPPRLRQSSRTARCRAICLFGNSDLKRVAAAVAKHRRLTIAVVGTGSSILAGPDGRRRPIRRASRLPSASGCPRSQSRS